MDLSKEFGIDDDLAESGRWFRVDDDGTELLVAALPNRAYDRFLEQPRRRAQEIGKPVATTVIEEALAKTVLLDWKGVTYNGAALESTEGNRLSMLRKFWRFQQQVVNLATQNKLFQRAADEAEEKNSLNGLNGSSGLAHLSAT